MADNNITVSTTVKRKSLKADCYYKTESHFECKICKKQFSLKTSHTMLKRHTINSHTPSTSNTSANNSVQKKKSSYYDKLIVNFIVHGSHSFNIVEEEHFKTLVSQLNPAYSLINRPRLVTNITELFNEKQEQLKARLNTLPNKISLTLDFWTSVTMKPYMVGTAHFMMDSKLISLTLDFDIMPYPHKSSDILRKIIQILDNYNLEGKIISITTDNEASNIKFMQLLMLFNNDYEDVKHFRCFAHVLNLSVKNGLKHIEEPISAISRLIKHINNSPKEKQTYIEVCDRLYICL